jgi:hypothetical protein
MMMTTMAVTASMMRATMTNEQNTPTAQAARRAPPKPQRASGVVGTQLLLTTAAVAATIAGWATLAIPQPEAISIMVPEPTPPTPVVIQAPAAMRPPDWLTQPLVIPTSPALREVVLAAQAPDQPAAPVAQSVQAAPAPQVEAPAPVVVAAPAPAPVPAAPAPALREVSAPPPMPAPVTVSRSSR